LARHRRLRSHAVDRTARAREEKTIDPWDFDDACDNQAPAELLLVWTSALAALCSLCFKNKTRLDFQKEKKQNKKTNSILV
jgi:hypothetical protein